MLNLDSPILFLLFKGYTAQTSGDGWYQSNDKVYVLCLFCWSLLMRQKVIGLLN